MKMESKKLALDKVYKRRDRFDIPEWQRQEVWATSKKQNLIDTILRGWKLPKFYLLKVNSDPEEFEVVDGQQRMATILEFMENELSLADETAQHFEAKFYKDLQDKYSDQFDDYEIECDQIEDATEEEVKLFFQRLQEGLPLTTSEKLNSVHSKLRDFVRRLTQHPFFKKVVASNKRYGHFDIVAKASAIEIDGLEVGARYDDLRAVFESQSQFSDHSNAAKRLIAALDCLDRIFQKSSPNLRNRTIVQSLITFVCRLVQAEKAAGHEQSIGQFFEKFLQELSHQIELGQNATDHEYLRFQRTVNANVKTGARIRHTIMFRKLLSHDPTFFSSLDTSNVLDGGLGASIKQDASDIISLIGRLNETHAALKGVDLFKPTNKTIQAQGRLSTPIANFPAYKSFIEDLFFIFDESVGDRLSGHTPQSFSDVNLLRTGLQHDIDHGDKSKAAAKRKKIGETFRKYSGEPSPESLTPDHFLVVQANILGALKREMEVLKIPQTLLPHTSPKKQ